MACAHRSRGRSAIEQFVDLLVFHPFRRNRIPRGNLVRQRGSAFGSDGRFAVQNLNAVGHGTAYRIFSERWPRIPLLFACLQDLPFCEDRTKVFGAREGC